MFHLDLRFNGLEKKGFRFEDEWRSCFAGRTRKRHIPCLKRKGGRSTQSCEDAQSEEAFSALLPSVLEGVCPHLQLIHMR